MPESRRSLAVPPVEMSSMPERGELAGEINESRLIGDAEDGALDAAWHAGPFTRNALQIG